MCFTCKANGNTFSCVDLGECCLPRQCSHLACAIHQSNHLFWFHAHSAPSAAASWPSQSSESDLKHLPLRLSAYLLLQQLCLEKIIGLIKEKNAADPSSALRCSNVGFHIGRAIVGTHPISLKSFGLFCTKLTSPHHLSLHLSKVPPM